MDFYANYAFIVQARIGSSRLPGKVLLKFSSSTVLGHLIHSLKKQGVAPKNIIIATTINPLDDLIEDYAKSLDVSVVRGDEFNVTKRFQDASQLTDCQHIIRLTADNPIIDFDLLFHCLERHKKDQPDLTTTREINRQNKVTRYVPKGSSLDLLSKSSLLNIDAEAISPFEQEHVIPYFFRHLKVSIVVDFASVRPPLSIDTIEDYKKVCAYYASSNRCT